MGAPTTGTARRAPSPPGAARRLTAVTQRCPRLLSVSLFSTKSQIKGPLGEGVARGAVGPRAGSAWGEPPGRPEGVSPGGCSGEARPIPRGASRTLALLLYDEHGMCQTSENVDHKHLLKGVNISAQERLFQRRAKRQEWNRRCAHKQETCQTDGPCPRTPTPRALPRFTLKCLTYILGRQSGRMLRNPRGPALITNKNELQADCYQVFAPKEFKPSVLTLPPPGGGGWGPSTSLPAS